MGDSGEFSITEQKPSQSYCLARYAIWAIVNLTCLTLSRIIPAAISKLKTTKVPTPTIRDGH